jgi:signal transduction histidine kinase
VRKRRAGGRPLARWPSEAEQTFAALRAGRIDALVVAEGEREGVYALRTFEELEAANNQLRESQERLLIALNERERLMQDLHDGCIQSIYAIGLALEDCRGLIRQKPGEAAAKIAHAEASLNLVIQELRAFISGAKVDAPVELTEEIRRLVLGVGTRGPRFEVKIDERAAKALPREHAAQLLQIVREALSNVLRHADARSARVALRKRGRTVRLEVADDGRGFDKNAEGGPGLGLHHIAARVQKLGGRLQLNAKPSRGCCVLVDVVI